MRGTWAFGLRVHTMKGKAWAGWAGVAGALVATLAALVLLQAAERRKAGAEVNAALADRRKLLDEVVTAQLKELELRGQNAGSNPRLVAALSGNVSRETLRDLFQTESWWQPYREAFTATYLGAPGARPIFITGRQDEALERAGAIDALVTRARTSRAVTSALVGLPGVIEAVVAVPVIMPNAVSPVLLLVQPFDGAKIGSLAERTGGAILVSDGKQPLVGAGASAETAILRQAIGREADALTGLRTGGAGVVAHEAARDLYLLSHVATAPIVARATAGLSTVRVVIGLLGGGLVLALVALMLRKSKPVLVAEPTALSAAVTEASSGSRYTLLQRIGGGGMAEVHLAVSVGERGFRRPCVVKRLRPELCANANAVAQFTDEATLASSLVHANIVPIFDFARVGSQYFLVEEYIVGRDLGRLVRRARAIGKSLPQELVAYIAVEALKALDYAHGKRDHDGLPLGIVHRDVSPENLMITIRGEVQLLDFGVLKTDDKRGRTDIGELKGNLSYISPEQARGLDVDGRADLFSLGLVIYFALTGEPLYGTDAGYDLLVRAASGPGPTEIAKLARLPEPWGAILTRALSPRAEGRFQNAAAFAEALTPHTGDAAFRLAALVADLFGDELAEEQQHLSQGARNTTGVTGTGAGSQPGALAGAAVTPIPRIPAARGN